MLFTLLGSDFLRRKTRSDSSSHNMAQDLLQFRTLRQTTPPTAAATRWMAVGSCRLQGRFTGISAPPPTHTSFSYKSANIYHVLVIHKGTMCMYGPCPQYKVYTANAATHQGGGPGFSLLPRLFLSSIFWGAAAPSLI